MGTMGQPPCARLASRGRRAAFRSGLGPDAVADEQRGKAIDLGTAEDPAAGVGIPEVEAAGHLAGGVIGVTVELPVVFEQFAEVGEQLEVVVDPGGSPNLGRVTQIGVARVDDALGVVALNGSVGRVGGAVFHAEVEKTVLPHRQPDVAGYRQVLAVSADSVAGVLDVADDPRPAGRLVSRICIEVRPGLEFQAAARGSVLQLEVHDAGDGVRTVLGCRAVAQHLQLPNGYGGNGGDVGSLRAVGNAVSQPGDDGRAMAALPVDQDQRVVGRQVPQVGRPDHGGRIADRLGVDVEGGDHRPQLGCQVPAPLAGEVLGTE